MKTLNGLGPAGQLALAVAMGLVMPLTGFGSDKDIPKLEGSTVMTAKGKIVELNQTTRAVTILGEGGRYVTFTVDPKVQGLDNLRAGDTVTAGYYVSLAMELRDATPEEKADPLKVSFANPVTDTSAKGTGRVIRAVCELVAVQKEEKTITFKGPLGRSFLIRARDTDDLAKLKVGNPIVVTYAEGIATSLKRAD